MAARAPPADLSGCPGQPRVLRTWALGSAPPRAPVGGGVGGAPRTGCPLGPGPGLRFSLGWGRKRGSRGAARARTMPSGAGRPLPRRLRSPRWQTPRSPGRCARVGGAALEDGAAACPAAVAVVKG